MNSSPVKEFSQLFFVRVIYSFESVRRIHPPNTAPAVSARIESNVPGLLQKFTVILSILDTATVHEKPSD